MSTAEVLHTKRGVETTMLAIDLLSPGVLDTTLLDARLKIASGITEDSGNIKFFVVNDRLIIFDERKEHGKEYEDLDWVFGISGKPQCAGMISFNFTDSGLRGPRRKIYGHSSSLAYMMGPEYTLTTKASDQYKQTVLREKLGEHFVIE